MSALNKNAQQIKHQLEDYDQRRTMQTLMQEGASFHCYIDKVIEEASLMEDDGSFNQRLLQDILDKAESRRDLIDVNEEKEANGHDAYVEEGD